jgi:hypothetical protein
MGVVKWYIAFIDNYVDKILILFQHPRSSRIDPAWIYGTFCVFILINMYFEINEWYKRGWMNLFICRTKLLYVINVNAINWFFSTCN